jgi:crotonobetainyl-CoA:carnitine CoA-transferase CaiB-like acyl-CoA transferase
MAALLGPVRILDLSSGPLSYCGRLLADLDADVVLVEPPGGPAARRAANEGMSGALVGTREVVSERYGGTPGDRGPYVDELDGWIEDLTTRYGKQELAEEAQRRGIPVCPVNSVTDLLADPHLAATDSWISVPSPQGSVRMPAAALSVDGLALPVGPIPSAGADNAEILTAELSLSEPELLRLRQAGVV